MLNEANFMAYVRKMHQLNEIAAQEMQAYIDQFGFDNMTYLVTKAYQIATKYGEGTSSLATLLYDYLAEHQGAKVPPAVPAPTATLDETWGAVQGSLNECSQRPRRNGIRAGRSDLCVLHDAGFQRMGICRTEC